MVYSNNRISKINLESFESTTRYLKNSYNLKQDLVDIFTLKKDIKLKVKNDKKQMMVDTKDYRLTNSRNATGVYISPSKKVNKSRDSLIAIFFHF